MKSEAEMYEENEENATLTELFDDYLRGQAAVTKIQHETLKFKGSVTQAFRGVRNTVQAIERLRLTMLCESANDGDDNDDSESGSESNFAVISCLSNQATPLEPYYGHLRILKTAGFHLLSSWHKRWFYLDFVKGELLFYQRSYWKIPKGKVIPIIQYFMCNVHLGKVEMKLVSKIVPLNTTDFQV